MSEGQDQNEGLTTGPPPRDAGPELSNQANQDNDWRKRLGPWIEKHRRLITFGAIALFVVLPMMWIATCLAIRSGIYLPWANKPKNPPDTKLIQVFLVFIGGGLAATVTLIGSLLAYDHNSLERQRLKEQSQQEHARLKEESQLANVRITLDSTIRDLELLTSNKQARVAGALANMVKLGHSDVALRTLDPIWTSKEVDPATATWVIDQVLLKENADSPAVNEATTMLMIHARSLIDAKRKVLGWPGHLQHWNRDLSVYSKHAVVVALTELIMSQSKSRWNFQGQDGTHMPVRLLMEATTDKEPKISAAASSILDTLRDCCPGAVPDKGTHTQPKSSDVPSWAIDEKKKLTKWASASSRSRITHTKTHPDARSVQASTRHTSLPRGSATRNTAAHG